MAITYKNTHDFREEDLRDLFLSVEWSSGHYPDRLVTAMQNYETVFTAWDGDALAGLICAMDDGIMTAYIHYLLVAPAYQHQGIGGTLVEMVKEKYKDYLRVFLIAYDDEAGFYDRLGFAKAEGKSMMQITKLWT